jgi:hypothetical protein
MCAARSAATGNHFHASHESWICLPYPIVFCSAAQRELLKKKKMKPTSLKNLATKFLHHLMHINNITRLYAN